MQKFPLVVNNQNKPIVDTNGNTKVKLLEMETVYDSNKMCKTFEIKFYDVNTLHYLYNITRHKMY